MSLIPTVQAMYAAFSRGEVDTILSHLADNVDWEYGSTTDIPVLQRRSGRHQVAGFFAALSAIHIEKFEPKHYFENGSVVVVLLDLIATVKTTGRAVTEEDEVHIWHFNPAGQVTRFRHRVDTHQHVLAWQTA